MTLIELVLIAIGLSMDAFAVAICKGLAMPKISYKQATLIAVFFGGFQGLMPLIGWALGTGFEKYVTPIDHWVAFILLAFIGGKMIVEAIRGEEEDCNCFSIKELFVLAIATSIDALAVGITFAFLRVNILTSVSLIGIITFALSFVGVMIGHFFGARFKKIAELSGGVILILIGLKILLEHLEILVL